MDSRLHPVFHVSLLKKSVGPGVPTQAHLPAVSEAGTIDPIPSEILDHRWIKRGKKIMHEVLVRWANLPIDDATWEDPHHLHQRFPTLDLEGKVGFEGVGNDKNRPAQAHMSPSLHVLDYGAGMWPKDKLGVQVK